MKYYVATVQILFQADGPPEAVDTLSVHLSENGTDNPDTGLIDWAYLKVAGQYMYPTERQIELSTYEEGDFL